jgi:hypothetical protein
VAGDLVPVYYLSGTAASLTAVLLGARSYNTRQRKKWIDEGAAAQEQTNALKANTQACAANTAAISQLAAKLDGFAEETRRELSNHNGQLITHREEIGRLRELVVDRRSRGTP